jgi:hypothetical protein
VQGGDLPRQRAQVDPGERERDEGPGEVEELVEDAPHAIDLAPEHGEPLGALADREVIGEEGPQALHRGERVLQLMGDLARQRRQLLRPLGVGAQRVLLRAERLGQHAVEDLAHRVSGAGADG